MYIHIVISLAYISILHTSNIMLSIHLKVMYIEYFIGNIYR